ncbi:MAG: Mrp/NBP35 family ATP-binding protein [Bdellovibrionales bacterium]|jgi:ATP-binding protein involved in chromosome partitioning
MPLPSQADILRALGGVELPNSDDNIVHAGMVSAISIQGGEDGSEPQIQLVIEVDPAMGDGIEAIRQNALAQVRRATGIGNVSVIMTAHRGAPATSTSPKDQAQPSNPPELPKGVKNIIAVASAKGGVGKSTTAVNLALALHAAGLSVGILDADVHGPSIPRLMGLREAMEQNEEGLLIPHQAMGIAAMSIGLLVPEDAPIIWRGPMIHGALKQMLHQVDWGQRDVLILDMPPGTGDVPLSIAQHVPLTGAVIVSTPQDLALQDVRKGVAMFEKMGVPLMGMIENMSAFECPHCRGITPIFGHGGAREDAERMNIPFLGHMPLALALREMSDAGTPVVHADPEGTYAMMYHGMAAVLRGKMGLT